MEKPQVHFLESNTTRYALLALAICLALDISGNYWKEVIPATVTQYADGGVITCLGILLARATGIGATSKLSYRKHSSTDTPDTPDTTQEGG
jgi:hypothetical protein